MPTVTAVVHSDPEILGGFLSLSEPVCPFGTRLTVSREITVWRTFWTHSQPCLEAKPLRHWRPRTKR